MTTLIGFDTETELMGKGAVTPDFICASFAFISETGLDTFLISEMTEGYMDIIKDMLRDKDNIIVAHNAQYDMRVIARDDQEMMDLVWGAAMEGRFKCTLLREKLLNLYEWGSIEFPNGRQALYAQDKLELKYLNLDRSEEKKGGVRTSYSEVRNIPVEDWPADYTKYAEDDPKGCLSIYMEQEIRRREIIQSINKDPFCQEDMRVQASFGCALMTETGLPTDEAEILKVTNEFEALYRDPRLVDPLVIAGICVPAVPEMPSGRVKHEKECRGHSKHPQYMKGLILDCDCPMKYTKAHVDECNRKGECDCPPKMKKAQKEKTSVKTLHDHVWNIARNTPDMEVWLAPATSKGLKKREITFGKYSAKQIMVEGNKVRAEFLDAWTELPTGWSLQVNKDWMEQFADMDETLALFKERKKLQKMITSYIPRMYWEDENGVKLPTDRIHADFDVLKETGRTSSKGTDLYPSWNGQQVDPRIRGCAIAEEGHMLVSIDYNAMELGTAAQKCIDLFGYSVLGDVINAGEDAHGFLGAQIAYSLDKEFKGFCDENRTLEGCESGSDNVWADYGVFKQLKGLDIECDSEDFAKIHSNLYSDKPSTWATFYNHYRKFAKPTGLGYPGGLMPKTFIQFARATYGVEVDVKTAEHLREVWLNTFTEMKPYLDDFVKKQSLDPNHKPIMVEDDEGSKKKRTFYAYETRMGLYRPRTGYCPCANGAALQSPSAEGALLGLIEMQRLCYTTNDTCLSRVGHKTAPVKNALFIHDEVLGQFLLDGKEQERIKFIQEIMRRNMETVTPDVKAGTEPAAMLRWSKYADPVWAENGDLLVWEPKEK